MGYENGEQSEPVFASVPLDKTAVVELLDQLAAQSTPTSDVEFWFDAKAVASLLDVKPVTVYAWAKAGKLRCRKVGGGVRFKASDIAAFLEAGTVK